MADPIGNPFQLDMGLTLTNVRTYGRTYDLPNDDRKSRVPNPSGGVEEVDSMRLDLSVDAEIGMHFDRYERMDVNNRAERPDPEHNRKLWGAAMARDGGRCWMCFSTFADMYVLDHLIPRSAFDVGHIRAADRSDNLRIACWDCNQAKSNRLIPFRQPLPIVWTCPDCYRRGIDDDEPLAFLDDYADEVLPVFCARHRAAGTAPADWPVAGLE